MSAVHKMLLCAQTIPYFYFTFPFKSTVHFLTDKKENTFFSILLLKRKVEGFVIILFQNSKKKREKFKIL